MKKVYLLICIFLPLFFSCTASYKNYQDYEVKTTYDEFEKRDRNVLVWNLVNANVNYLNVTLINIYDHKNKTSETSLEIVYSAEDWLFIKEDNSLSILIDGEKYDYNTIGNVVRNTDKNYNKVYTIERAFYDVPKDILYKIANAKSVKVKVSGNPYFVTGEFTKKNYENFKRFLKEYDK